MNKMILCPKCDKRGWSSDYWGCSNCGYEESREWALLEENKDYLESKDKGDNQQLDLNFWMREQKKLCQDMVSYLLPNHNLKPISFRKNKSWGCTIYRENDQNKAELAKKRFRTNGGIGEYIDWFKGPTPYYKWGVKYLITYDPKPTEINISPHALITEQSNNTIHGVIRGDNFVFSGTGAGFLPTTAHESAHASHEVNWDENFLPWINEGHDHVWQTVYLKFFNKLQQEYGEQVKKRFIEYRKITGEEENKYD